MSIFSEAIDYLFGGQFARDVTGGFSSAGDWIEDYVNAPKEAAQTIANVTREQIDLQRQALNYAIQNQAIPLSYKNEATVRLGQLYGLSGSPSFIGQNPPENSLYQPPIDAGITANKLTNYNNSANNQQQQVGQEKTLAKKQFGGNIENLPEQLDPSGSFSGGVNEFSGTNLADPTGRGRDLNESSKQPDILNIKQTSAQKFWEHFLYETTPEQRAKTYLESSEADRQLIWNKSSDTDRQMYQTALANQNKGTTDTGTTGTTGATTDGTQLELEYQGQKYPEMSSADVQRQMIEQAKASPLYESILSGRQAGEESILRQQSAIGKLRSGSSAHALYDYNTQLQNQALMTTYNQQLQGLNQMAGYTGSGQSIIDQINQMAQTGAMGGIGSAQTLLSGQYGQMNNILQGIGALGSIIASI